MRTMVISFCLFPKFVCGGKSGELHRMLDLDRGNSRMWSTCFMLERHLLLDCSDGLMFDVLLWMGLSSLSSSSIVFDVLLLPVSSCFGATEAYNSP